MFEFLITCQPERSASEIGVILVFLTFFINFYMKTLIKNMIYCQALPLEYLLMYVVKIVNQISLLSFSTWVSLAIFCLDQWIMEILCSAQPQLLLVEDNSLVHINLEWWQLNSCQHVELHVNATYCAQHPTLKSVYGKSQPVIDGKLSSSYRTVFELAQRTFEIPKQVTWIAPIWHLSRKKHWPYVKTAYLHHSYVFYHYHQF